jgi:hypothetical protein
VSFDLDILHGDPYREDEADNEELDLERATSFLASLPDIKGGGDEYEWIPPAGGVAAQYYLALVDGSLREIGVAVAVIDEPAAGDGFRTVLRATKDLADALGADLYDPQADMIVTVATYDKALASFGF